MTDSIAFSAKQVFLLDETRVGLRHRQDMGDLQAFPNNMCAIGLLQPIGITGDFALVSGKGHGKPAEETLASGRQFFAKTSLHPLRLKDIKVVEVGQLRRFSGRTRLDLAAAERITLPIKSPQRIMAYAELRCFSINVRKSFARKCAVSRAIAQHYDKLKFMLAGH